MSEQTQALVPATKLTELSRAGAPPVGMPVAIEDWGAWSQEDRIEALNIYHEELGRSLEHIKPEFPKWVMPTGGQLAFTGPDGMPVKVIEAVMIFHTAARAWWKSQEVTGSLPDCSSYDGQRPATGKGPKGETDCSKCPLNEFGSGKEGRGKACKERLNAFFVRKDDRLPNLLPLPPTSIRPFSRYVTALINGGKPLSAVVTELSLEKKQAGGGQAYSVVVAKVGREMTFAEMKTARDMRIRFQDEMQRRGIAEADLKDEEAPATTISEPGANDRVWDVPAGDIRHGDDEPPPRGDDDVPF